jgi:hypothetical protein
MHPPDGAQRPASTGFSGLTRWFSARRPLLARVLLVGGVLVVAEQLVPFWPRQTDLELDLGARHGEVTELRLSYLQAGEELKGVSLRYASGAPTRVRQPQREPAERSDRAAVRAARRARDFERALAHAASAR